MFSPRKEKGTGTVPVKNAAHIAATMNHVEDRHFKPHTGVVAEFSIAHVEMGNLETFQLNAGSGKLYGPEAEVTAFRGKKQPDPCLDANQ
ncbi:hypothetical protein N7478_006416 [Penicillium angulare]|uniref:uncharacterized protein n=1 Tax=Penicillium angulare TaxID=116970 RepID=UPI0025424150|nr:uncharacterized protein N7478_006416 [Penicillium angulare]KAJ5281044.1 hypothetical protein N7478_006416 [Penicillium angulare]